MTEGPHDVAVHEILTAFAHREGTVLQAVVNLDRTHVLPTFTKPGLRAGYRVRSWERRGGNDFTVRHPHEWNGLMLDDDRHRIDVLLYAITVPGGGRLAYHTILRLGVWREVLRQYPGIAAPYGLGFGPISNGDGTYFVKYSIGAFPGLLVADRRGRWQQQGLPLDAPAAKGFDPYD